MNGWALFSLAIVAVPAVAAVIWILNEQASNRRRQKFLQCHEQRSVSGIRNRIERELANEDTHVMPRVHRGPLAPDPLQDGRITGRLPLSKRPRRYARQCTRVSRRSQSELSR